MLSGAMLVTFTVIGFVWSVERVKIWWRLGHELLLSLLIVRVVLLAFSKTRKLFMYEHCLKLKATGLILLTFVFGVTISKIL